MQGYLIQELGDGSESGWDPDPMLYFDRGPVGYGSCYGLHLLEFDSLKVIQTFFYSFRINIIYVYIFFWQSGCLANNGCF